MSLRASARVVPDPAAKLAKPVVWLIVASFAVAALAEPPMASTSEKSNLSPVPTAPLVKSLMTSIVPAVWPEAPPRRRNGRSPSRIQGVAALAADQLVGTRPPFRTLLPMFADKDIVQAVADAVDVGGTREGEALDVVANREARGTLDRVGAVNLRIR